MELAGRTPEPDVVAPTTSPDVIRDVEVRARRAWPALEVESREGWILRAAEGITRRSNSVHAVGPVADPDRAIAAAAGWFAARGLPLRFYLTPVTVPGDLEARLTARGWEREGGARVQLADLPLPPVAHLPSGDVQVRIEEHLTDAWFDRFAAWRGIDAGLRPAHRRILERVPPRCAFVGVGEDEPHGVGLAVAEGGWVGLFDLVVSPVSRRRGWGRALVRSLLDWGMGAGARRAYLQVDGSNAPAIALYEALGFRTAYAYVYRRAPEPLGRS